MPEAVRLKYSAPAECPDEADFVARVRERTARGRWAEPGELARTFTVGVSADPPGYVGNVEFLDDSAGSVSRRVHGEQCDAVVSSLALITALSLDATLRGEQVEPPAPEPARAPAPLVAPPSVATPTLRPVPSRAARLRSTPSLESVRIGLSGGYRSGLDAPRLGVLAELVWRSQVALRLTAHYEWHETTLDAGRSAKLRQQGIELSVCPRRLRWASFAFSPCAAVDLGSLSAEGVRSTRLTSVNADTVWWSSLGLQLGLAYEPQVPFWVELRGAAELPLRAGYRFTFDSPRGVAYEVPNFAGAGVIAAGVRFW